MTDDEFAAAVEQTQLSLRTFIACQGVATQDVDDVAQEVYLAWHRAGCSVPEGVAPLAWLIGIARNLVFRWYRAQGRRGRAIERLAALVAQAGPSPHEREELHALEQLRLCLDRLPSDKRALVTKRYLEAHSIAAIAAEQQVGASTVAMSLLRVRDLLRHCVERGLAQA